MKFRFEAVIASARSKPNEALSLRAAASSLLRGFGGGGTATLSVLRVARFALWLWGLGRGGFDLIGIFLRFSLFC